MLNPYYCEKKVLLLQNLFIFVILATISSNVSSMKSFIRISELNEYLKPFRKQNKKIGFVPTMGALHKGHISLLRQSIKENAITVCSIFVNPKQFNNPSDLVNYPRRMEQDSQILEQEGVEILFAPEVDEMYPPGEKETFSLDLKRLDRIMEGKYRPGHFAGVALVVYKLFDIVKPDKAYFGKKDLQQLRIIQHMVKSLEIPVEIIPCETIREEDGLAMSSRNLRLSIGEREKATRIYDVLMYTKANVKKMPVKKLQILARKRLAEEPAFRLDYFEIVDDQSLLPLSKWEETSAATACVAVYLNDIRLIDNMELFS
jgi:pantoate--beta-alanine ligase